eukprot:TRINITY_DN221_c0_g1_i3.p2 TRINITY_DN221_c0_g1~~TRINITY_DN221_c0_g1_i3.p2  ORF type:complete len:239 (-),score=41.95 TRINITY_DN221_c0_g1_i3:1514-2230(-)
MIADVDDFTDANVFFATARKPLANALHVLMQDDLIFTRLRLAFCTMPLLAGHVAEMILPEQVGAGLPESERWIWPMTAMASEDFEKEWADDEYVLFGAAAPPASDERSTMQAAADHDDADMVLVNRKVLQGPIHSLDMCELRNARSSLVSDAADTLSRWSTCGTWESFFQFCAAVYDFLQVLDDVPSARGNVALQDQVQRFWQHYQEDAGFRAEVDTHKSCPKIYAVCSHLRQWWRST